MDDKEEVEGRCLTCDRWACEKHFSVQEGEPICLSCYKSRGRKSIVKAILIWVFIGLAMPLGFLLNNLING